MKKSLAIEAAEELLEYRLGFRPSLIKAKAIAMTKRGNGNSRIKIGRAVAGRCASDQNAMLTKAQKTRTWMSIIATARVRQCSPRSTTTEPIVKSQVTHPYGFK